MSDASKYLGIAILLIGVFMLAGGSLPFFSLFEQSTPYTGGWTIGKADPDITSFIPARDLSFLNEEQQNILRKLPEANSYASDSREAKLINGLPDKRIPSQGLSGILGLNDSNTYIFAGYVPRSIDWIRKPWIGEYKIENSQVVGITGVANLYYDQSFNPPINNQEFNRISIVTKEPINNKSLLLNIKISAEPSNAGAGIDVGISNADLTKRYCNIGSSNTRNSAVLETGFNNSNTKQVGIFFGDSRETFPVCTIITGEPLYAFVSAVGVEHVVIESREVTRPINIIQVNNTDVVTREVIKEVIKEVIVYNNTGSQVQSVDVNEVEDGKKSGTKWLGILLLIIGIVLLFV